MPLSEREIFYSAVVLMTILVYAICKRFTPAAAKKQQWFLAGGILLSLAGQMLIDAYITSDSLFAGTPMWAILAFIVYNIHREVQKASEETRTNVAVIVSIAMVIPILYAVFTIYFEGLSHYLLRRLPKELFL